MKTIKFLLFTFLFWSVCTFGQDSQYSGLVLIKPCSHRVIFSEIKTPTGKFITIRTTKNVDLSTFLSDTNSIHFYKFKNDTIPIQKLSFYFDWKFSRKEKLIEKDSLAWLNSTYSNLSNQDLCFLAFMCKTKKGKWLEVVVNDSTESTMWIKASKITKYTPWNKLSFKKIVGLPIINLTSESKIYKKPNLKSAVILNPNNYSSYEIIKAKDDWMKISNKNNEWFTREESEKSICAWVRYKMDGKLLVNIQIY